MNYPVTSVQTLIDAIVAANGQDPNVEHVITLEASFPPTATVTATNGSLFGNCAFPVIIRNIRIVGNGKTIHVTVSNLRHFGINGKNGNPSAKLTLENLGLKGGSSPNGGGSIVNDGTTNAAGGVSLVIKKCHINLNTGTGNGGMLYNGDNAKCRIFDSVIADNTVTGTNPRGGAIYNSSGATLFIRGTTFKNNEAVGTAGRGGAVYIWSGTVDIKNSSFVGNKANGGEVSPSMTVFRSTTSVPMDVTWNWWNSVAPVNAQAPYLTNLPSFVRPGGYTGENPSLPPASTIPINTWNGTVQTQLRGPSAEDRSLSQNNTPTFARARTNDNQWVGYVHPDRLDYLTWSHVSTIWPEVSTRPSLTNLPDFTPQSDNDYSALLSIKTSPLEVIDTARPNQVGFGIYNAAAYSQFPSNSHPGFDFFSANSGVNVFAVAGGIVVGIGIAASSAPGSWGALPFNVVVRTGGYFLLYGHLESIDLSIYLGARVGPGAVLGKLAYQTVSSTDLTNNTHLHLEVRTFRPESMNYSQLAENTKPLYCEYGKIRPNAQQVTTIPPHPRPGRVIDPMYFVTTRGLSTPPATVEHERIYTGTTLTLNDQTIQFNYRVLEKLNQQSMNLAASTNAPSVPVAPTALSC